MSHAQIRVVQLVRIIILGQVLRHFTQMGFPKMGLIVGRRRGELRTDRLVVVLENPTIITIA